MQILRIGHLTATRTQAFLSLFKIQDYLPKLKSRKYCLSYQAVIRTFLTILSKRLTRRLYRQVSKSWTLKFNRLVSCEKKRPFQMKLKTVRLRTRLHRPVHHLVSVLWWVIGLPTNKRSMTMLLSSNLTILIPNLWLDMRLFIRTC